jgi:tetratricopeptide (TPR) repeat protein
MGAATTFFYIAKHFKWLPEVVTEAQIWQALSYCAMDWTYEADNILSHIKPAAITTPSLKRIYNMAMADYAVRTDDYQKAIPYLTEAAKSSHGTQKNRLYFLLGQAYAQLGQKQPAYLAFKKAGAGSGLSYRAKFNARIKQSEVFTGTDIRKEVNSLRAMTRYQRNKEYFDQIYYAIGNLYLSRKDTVNAKTNYSLAIEKSTRSGIDKALAQLALGNILFAEGDYVKAQPLYSAAIPMLPESYPDYKKLKQRSDVLDELATYAGNVQLQDSLLTLSKMSEEEQMKVCTRLAEELKAKEKKEAEDKAREDYMAEQENKGNTNTNNSNSPTQFQLNTDKSWYFYNETSKSAGKREFQRKWGARKLEDDWRRRDKTSYSFDDEESDESAPNDTTARNDSVPVQEREATEHDNDPHYPEYYMKSIPRTEEEITNCNDIIQEGLYNMGLILKDKLDDYPAARKEFNQLNTRYPDNIYRLDVYYNLYLMAVKEGNDALAEEYRQLILKEFPESPYGQAMQDPNYFENLRRMNQVQEELYEEAYSAYLKNNNREVHTITKDMEEKYPLSKILPKFVFIDALSYLTDKDYDQFKERLTYLLQKWPNTDMTDMAGGILTGLKQGRVPNSGASNQRSLLWDIRLTNDTTTKASDGQPANFERDPSKPQYLVLAFPKDSVNANEVLYNVARNNFSWFVVKDFDLEPMSFGNVGLLVIKGFANQSELNHYRNVMARENNFNLPAAVRPIMISKANFELLLQEGRSFEEYFRFQEEETVKKKEEEVIPDTEEETPIEENEPATEEKQSNPEVEEENVAPVED